jgi:hypothetical protein
MLPSEHGGWGLTAEPVLLGLLVAPSMAGVAIGCAALLAFLARTPLKLVLVDTWRRRTLPRTRLAVEAAAVEIVALAVMLAVAARLATGPFWLPLVVAVPLVCLELWFDMRSRSRRLVPEVAGTIGIGSVAAAIVLADNGPAMLAAGAWLVIGARAVGSLPFVRFQLRRAKRQPHRRWAQDLAQVTAAALAIGGWLLGWLSGAAAIALAALSSLQLVLARGRPPRATVVGLQQLCFGVAVVIVAGLTMG